VLCVGLNHLYIVYAFVHAAAAAVDAMCLLHLASLLLHLSLFMRAVLLYAWRTYFGIAVLEHVSLLY